MKYKIDDLRTIIQYARTNNISDWVSIRFEDSDKLVLMFEDTERQTCELMVYPAKQSTTPKLKKISNLYYKE